MNLRVFLFLLYLVFYIVALCDAVSYLACLYPKFNRYLPLQKNIHHHLDNRHEGDNEVVVVS